MVEVIGQKIVTTALFVESTLSFYRARNYLQFETAVRKKIIECINYPSEDWLIKLYQSLDPIYEFLYFDIKMKKSLISRKIQKILEIASMPLYLMDEKDRSAYLVKLSALIG